MNGNVIAVKEFLKNLKPVSQQNRNTKNILCVPATLIAPAVQAARGCKLSIGGQTMHEAKSGAFTGELSADMLLEAGAEYVILGHSERRCLFAETDDAIRKKVQSALATELKPILCVGETQQERTMGITMEVIARQLKIALHGTIDVKGVIVAYEPVWAIGTGNTATAEEAQEVCQNIRTCLRELYGAKAARSVSILYGGSCNENNAAELLSQYDIDGALIGGASLKAKEFGDIMKIANSL